MASQQTDAVASLSDLAEVNGLHEAHLEVTSDSPRSHPETEASVGISNHHEQLEHEKTMSNGTDVQCDKCGKWGHAASKCSEEFCDCCQQKGHSIRKCRSRIQQEASDGVLELDRLRKAKLAVKQQSVAPGQSHRQDCTGPHGADFLSCHKAFEQYIEHLGTDM